MRRRSTPVDGRCTRLAGAGVLGTGPSDFYISCTMGTARLVGADASKGMPMPLDAFVAGGRLGPTPPPCGTSTVPRVGHTRTTCRPSPSSCALRATSLGVQATTGHALAVDVGGTPCTPTALAATGITTTGALAGAIPIATPSVGPTGRAAVGNPATASTTAIGGSGAPRSPVNAAGTRRVRPPTPASVPGMAP